MKTSFSLLAAALAVGTFAALPAFADSTQSPAPAQESTSVAKPAVKAETPVKADKTAKTDKHQDKSTVKHEPKKPATDASTGGAAVTK